MLKKLGIVLGIEWFVTLLALAIAGAPLGLWPAVVLAAAQAAGIVAVVKVVDDEDAKYGK
jgi:hypothetical protein